MLPSSGLDDLTSRMAQRQKHLTTKPLDPDCPEPYILFLGVGCSLAAGAPSIEEIAEKELTRLAHSDDDFTFDPKDKPKSLKKFYEWLEAESPGQVFRLFHAHYANTPVPVFYQELALLIKNNYFNRILTTNFDTLLEQALSGAGLIPDVDFEVTSFGVTKRESRRSRSSSDESSSDCPREPVNIIKLHGDLAEGELMVAPEQIEELLKSRRHMAKQGLKGDLVMVGYQFESPKLNDWLRSYRKRELWWVSEQQQNQGEVQSWGEHIEYIDGEVGKPDQFFSQLSLRLLRLPALSSQRVATKSNVEFGMDAPTEEAVTVPPEESEKILLDDLRGQIRRFQASLSSLEQKASPDERPTSLQVQIDYQKQQLMMLEDKLRSLSTSWPQLLELLRNMAESLRTARVDPELEQHISDGTINFLRRQYETVKEEYSSGEPNQQIISAAVGGAAILAERLALEFGPKVIKPEEVRDLASFVPTVATRGIK